MLVDTLEFFRVAEFAFVSVGTDAFVLPIVTESAFAWFAAVEFLFGSHGLRFVSFAPECGVCG